MTRRLLFPAALCAAALAVSVFGIAAATAEPNRCPPLPRGSERVTLSQADFVARVDNRLWPMAPGSRWIYRETDTDGSSQRVDLTVVRRSKTIQGVRATVIHDVVSEHGRLVEDTWDWYAQDKCGNVWYLGEATKAYRNGKVSSTEGSWEAGVDGAQPGVVVLAHPRDGVRYRQEYYAGKAEDGAEVLSVDEQAEVPFGHFSHVLLTKDFTPLEPRILEYKLYAKGVGPVLMFDISGGSSREELVSFTRPS